MGAVGGLALTFEIQWAGARARARPAACVSKHCEPLACRRCLIVTQHRDGDLRSRSSPEVLPVFRHRFACVWTAFLAAVSGMVVLGAPSPATAASDLQPLSSIASSTGPFELGNFHSGKCMDVPAFSTTTGVQLDQWTCKSSTNQEFRVTSADQLVNVHSGLCVDMKGGSAADGTHVIQWSCNANDLAQRWTVEQTDISGYVLLINDASGTCVQVNGASLSNGALLSGWSCPTIPGPHHFYWHLGLV